MHRISDCVRDNSFGWYSRQQQCRMQTLHKIIAVKMISKMILIVNGHMLVALCFTW